MAIKHLALAAIVAAGLSVAPSAKADTITDALGLSAFGQLFSNNFFQSSLSSSTSFLGALQTVASSYTYSQILGSLVSFANSTGPSTPLSTETFSVGYVTGESAVWSASMLFDSGSKSISFAGNTITAISGDNGSVVPVPGPEAGAGIGALAMAGLAFWMARRRKDDLKATAA